MTKYFCLKEGEMKILKPFWEISKNHVSLKSLVFTHKNGGWIFFWERWKGEFWYGLKDLEQKEA
jgi:hypothetical protein